MVKQTLTGPVEANNNYVAVVPMTFEERYHMYMRCKKEELAKMLTQRDILWEQVHPQVYPMPIPTYPSQPYIGDTPWTWNPEPYCTTNTSEAATELHVEG